MAAKWWFLLKGKEDVLVDLEGQRNSIELQTKWKLEPCFKPAPDAGDNSQAQTSSSCNQENCTDQDKAIQPPTTETDGECSYSNSSLISVDPLSITDTANPTNSSNVPTQSGSNLPYHMTRPRAYGGLWLSL